jgi:signal transduction histidine kinase
MKSLRQQLTRELLAVLTLLLGLGLLGLYWAMWVEINRSFNVALEARALGISALVEQEAGQLKVDFSERLLRSFNGGKKVPAYFELSNQSGELVTRSLSLGEGRLARPPVTAGEKPRFWDLELPNGRDGRAVCFLFPPKPAREHPGQAGILAGLVVAVDREELDETLGELFAAVAGCGVLLLGAVLLVVPRVLRRGLAPVNRLGSQAERIHAGSLAERFSVDDLPVELRPIGESLNALLARLETSFDRERRFSADLAHELRTPIAELRNLAECSLKWPSARDVSADQDTLAIALQMETLVIRLLSLARGEQGQLAVRNEVVEAAAAVASAWRPFAGRADERGLRVRLAVDPGDLTADPVLLRSVLSNLMDNAVNYTPAGGEVLITRTAAGGLSIANTVDQFTPEDLSRLFERFWRKESARSGGIHAGLGLSLAQAFATAMGWRLEAALVADRLVFTLANKQTPEA